jgi:dTDP-4-amino-4,6-dideoxygalactose transaminase
VVERLKAVGIFAGVHYPIPIHLQEAYANLGLGPGNFPVTEDAAQRILSLPLYPELSREQVETVSCALAQALAD